jgi:hypothetical protein
VVYLAALLVVVGVALYVAAPLIAKREPAGAQPTSREQARQLEMDRARHERALAVQALRELEFDREMKKLSEPDYLALRAPLEARALGAMAAIEALQAEERAAAAAAAREAAASQPVQSPPPAPEKPPDKRARKVVFCPQCGVRLRAEANFCVECGTALEPLRNQTMQAG